MDITKIPQYELLEHHYVRELESEGYLMRHKKTGARVFILENDDNNKVFNIAFRTVPTDSTGVAHIIEHTVLCGSDRYPVKDPFVELAKGSLNTFLNAMTYSDKTMYPLASTNDKDFFNLMSVYMDGVFHPNITKERKIFEQEGWHYEMDSPDGELTYNGVVYNEMKGAFSSADEILGRQVKAALYPDTTYAYESGGDPEFITDLTYESYLEFYHTYYHPSNSYIYLYGDLDMEKALNWMDHEYLSHYEKKEIDSAVTLQKPFNKMKEISLCYAASEDDDEGTYFTWSKVVSNALDFEKYLAFQVLEYVLLDAIMRSNSFAQFENTLKEAILSVTGDDSTCIMSFYGWNSYDNVKRKLAKRYDNVSSIVATIESSEKGKLDETLESVWKEYRKQTLFDEMQG